ncbi:MAG: response regulator [Halarcobacter sp.]
MSNPLVCTFNKNYLNEATILFIEDDNKVRQEAYEIFTGFFKKVIAVNSSEEAIKSFVENRVDIDVILTSIDLADESCIEILSVVRKLDWEIPILISSSFSDMDILLKAIKFNISNYIVKPIQLNTTLKIISKIMQKKLQKKELAVKNNELRQFMSILDSYNIICELDLNFNITTANDSFLANSGFMLDDLIGKEFYDELLHSNSEIPIIKIKQLLKNGKSWVGLSKKISKNGTFYYTHSTILPIFYNNGKIKKYIEFSTLISKYENEILALKKHILLLKSQNFKTNSELRKDNCHYTKLAQRLQLQVDENVNNAQKLLFELYDMKKRNAILEEKLLIQEKRFEEFQATVLCGQ